MNIATNISSGLSTGFLFSQCVNQENEIKQGKDYYITPICFSGELVYLSSIVQKSVECFFQSPSSLLAKIAYNAAPFLTIPFSLIAAAIQKGDYNQFVTHLENKKSWIAHLLPKAGPRTIQICNFFSEHRDKLTRIAMAVGAIALIVFGNYAFGCAVLVTLAYREIDKLHNPIIHPTISRFIETYMPIIADINLLIMGGPLLIQIIAIVELATTLIPPLNRFIQHQLDAGIRRCFHISGIPLKAFEAPLAEPKLTYEEINQILDDPDDSHYSINPAHCSKWAIDGIDFPEDHHFDDLMTFFNGIQWKHSVIRSKLKDDERFCSLLTSEKNIVQEQFDDLLAKQAQKSHQTSEAYALDWVRSNLALLIEGLKENISFEGRKADTATAISHCAKILAFLKKSQDPILKEGILLKLAVEAGFYCARGVERATDEIVAETVIPNGLSPEQLKHLGLLKNYELRIRQALQNARRDCVQSKYAVIKKSIPNVGDSVHVFDLYSRLSLGFYPMTTSNRNRIHIGHVFLTESVANIARSQMIENYRSKLDEVVHEQKEMNLVDYLRQKFQTSTQLIQEQKEALEERLADSSLSDLSRHRLMLVMIGVLLRNR